MWQNTWTEGNLLIQITFGETVSAELQLGWIDIVQIGVKNTKRIQVSYVMATNLIRSNEQLDLLRKLLSIRQN